MKFPNKFIDGITIFNETKDFIRLSNLNQEIWNILSEIEEYTKKVGCNQEKYIFQLIDGYPEVAQFKTSLTRYYLANNKKELAIKWTKETVKKHSNYFFGKVDLANYYLEIEEIEKAVAILGGNEMQLKNLILNRKEYMKIEFLEFYRIAIMIHFKKGEQNKALFKISEMVEIDNKHQHTKFIINNLKASVQYRVSLN